MSRHPKNTTTPPSVRTRLIPADEARDRLGGVSYWTLMRKVRAGELVGARISGRMMIVEESLERLIAKGIEDASQPMRFPGPGPHPRKPRPVPVLDQEAQDEEVPNE